MNPLLSARPSTGDAPASSAGVPASPIQESAWALEAGQPGAAGHILPVALALEGALDPALLGAALNDVVARHAVLRTRFAFERDRMLQVVVPALQVPLPVVDLRLLPAEVREVQAFRLAQDEAMRRFDLQKLPLLRAQLHLLENGRHILVLAFHRAVLDEASLGLLLRELAAYYDARRRGSSPALPALPFDYAEHAARRSRASARHAADLAWWKARLSGDPVAPTLPIEPASPAPARAGRRRVERLALPAGLRDRLLGFAQREGVDPLVVHLAALAAVIQRYCERDDFLLGIRTADRSEPGSEKVLGPFLRVLPWRADLAGEPSFRLLLDRIRADLREALAHAAPHGPASRARTDHAAPACPVQFRFEPDGLDGFEWPGLQVTPLELEAGLPPCALGLSVIERGPGLTLRAEYDGARHSAAGIQRLLGHYGTLLAAGIERPSGRVAELPLLTEPERRRLAEWNHTAAAFPRDATVPDLVAARGAATPDAPAVVTDEGTLSYAELERRSNQLAHLLRAAGVRPATVVGVLLESTPDLPVCQLALLKAGGTGLWLDPHRPRVHLDQLVAAAKPAFVLTHARWTESVAPGTPARALETMAEELAAAPSSPVAPIAGPDDAAWLADSGGTDGRPRLALLSHRALVCRLHALRHAPGVRPEDAVLVSGAVRGLPAAVQTLLPLTAGARLVLAAPADLASRPRLELLLARHAVTLLFGSPSDWERLLDTGWSGRPGLRLVSTGASLTAGLATRLRLCGRELWNIYGAVETAGGCLAQRVHARDAAPTLGRPLPNVSAHVLDRALRPLPVGLPGELFIGGEALAADYLGEAETAAGHFLRDPFRPEPGARLFRTGDLVRRLPSGELEYLARSAAPASPPAETREPVPSPARRDEARRLFPFFPAFAPLPTP